MWGLPPDLYGYDLGREWREHPGQAMVYAVWGVRREFAARAPALVAEVYRAFLRSLEYSMAHVAEIAQAAARWEPFPAAALEAYFRGLRFSFGPRYQAGLEEFARRAQRLGELDRIPDLSFVSLPAPAEARAGAW